MARTHIIRTAVAACVVGVLGALPGAAQAGLISGVVGTALPTCAPLSQPFGQFGDHANYYPVPDQGFESGGRGWTLTGGAEVVGDNEPWNVSGAGDRALSLPPGSSATSPATCINLLAPHIRMFARSAGADGPVQVQVVFRGLTGNLLGILNYGTFQPGDYPAWTPSGDVFSLLGPPLLTTSVQVKLTPLATKGSWRFDDVYIDPVKML